MRQLFKETGIGLLNSEELENLPARLQSSLSVWMETESYWGNGRAVGIATVTWAVSLEPAGTAAAAAAALPWGPGQLQGHRQRAIPSASLSRFLSHQSPGSV